MASKSVTTHPPARAGRRSNPVACDCCNRTLTDSMPTAYSWHEKKLVPASFAWVKCWYCKKTGADKALFWSDKTITRRSGTELDGRGPRTHDDEGLPLTAQIIASPLPRSTASVSCDQRNIRKRAQEHEAHEQTLIELLAPETAAILLATIADQRDELGLD